MTTVVFLIMVIIVITAGYSSVCAICLRRKAPGFYTICFDNSFYDLFFVGFCYGVKTGLT